MHRSRKKRNIIIFSLLGVLLCMTIGYAAYSTNLQISGTSKVTSSWDIRITGITAGTPTGSAENAVAPSYTNTTATMEANLYEKGDSMEYDVTIENKGTIDAKLNDIITNIENANSDAVSITFSGYTKGEKLLKGTAKVIHVKIAYNPNYEGGETSSEVEVKFDYTQNNNETEAPENTFLVTYDCTTNGGNDCSSNNEYLASGSNIDLTKTGTKKYYNFVGWNTNKDEAEGLTSLTVAQNDITLYAIFEPSDTTPPIIDSINTTSTTNSITAVVAAHDDESNISKYEFSINNGEYIDNGTSNVYTFTGLTAGTNYTIKVRVTNGVGMQSEKEASGIDLKANVVTTGDGLYEDSYEEGKYIYRGSNPNNYITYNNETWRIMSIEKDGTIKIVRNEVLEDRQYDAKGSRPQTGYCNVSSTFGCNIWGSSSTLYNASGSKITTLPRQVGSTAYTLPTAEANLNTYLNGTYYNSTLSSTARSQIESSWFNVGPVANSSSYTSSYSLSDNIEQSKAARWKGNIGLIDAIEYVKASTNSACDSVYDFYSNSTCYNNSQNYLNISDVFWTLSPYSRSSTSGVLRVYSDGSLGTSNSLDSRGVRPAISLKSTVKIVGGTGTSLDPYTLGSGTGTSKLEKPTFTESGVYPKTVTIKYPEGCGSNLTCTYQKDDGTVQTVTSSTVDVEFTLNGSVVANVTDGTNTESSTYTVTIQLKAEDLSYDNTQTSMACEDAQCALDEVKKKLSE